MRLHITGSSGFIGSYLVNFLKPGNFSITGLDVNPPKNQLPGNCFFECDILDKNKLRKSIQKASPEVIIHLAAQTNLSESENLDFYAPNIEGVSNLVDAIKHTPSVRRCIIASTQLVNKVGEVSSGPDDSSPSTLYGESKRRTELIVHRSDCAGIEWCIIRPTTIWGPGMRPHYCLFLKMIQKRLYFHVGSKPLLKSYGFVGNTAYQLKKIIEAPADLIHRKTLYLADYKPLCLKSWADCIQKELNARPIPTFPESLARVSAKIGDMINYLGYKNFPFNSFRLNNVMTEYTFDLSETRSVCGDLPYSVEHGVKEMIKWFISKNSDLREDHAGHLPPWENPLEFISDPESD